MPTTLLDEDRGDWAAARARRFREEADFEARRDGTTLCWKCSRTYDITRMVCPLCGATNANVDLEAAQAELA